MVRAFRLQALERLRSRALKERRLELGRAAEVAARAAAEATQRAEQERRAREELSRRIEQPGAARMWSDVAEGCRRGRRAAQVRLAGAREAESRALEAVVKAQQELKVVERLRERREEEARQIEHRAQERVLNDLNAGRYFRRQLEERPEA